MNNNTYWSSNYEVPFKLKYFIYGVNVFFPFSGNLGNPKSPKNPNHRKNPSCQKNLSHQENQNLLRNQKRRKNQKGSVNQKYQVILKQLNLEGELKGVKSIMFVFNLKINSEKTEYMSMFMSYC